MDAVRKIKVFKSYYKEFYIAQTEAVRKKIDYVKDRLCDRTG